MTEKHCLILTQVTSLCQPVAYWESEGTEGSRHTGTQGSLSSSPSSLSRRAKAQRRKKCRVSAVFLLLWKGRKYFCVQTAKNEVCDFDDSTYELNGLIFAFKTATAQCSVEWCS